MAVIYLDAADCDPPHGLDLASAHDANKVAQLVDAFARDGFGKEYPALVGYPLNGRIQLLSGTHRHYAALLTGVKLPVTLWLRSHVEDTWGTDEWKRTMRDISVDVLSARQLPAE